MLPRISGALYTIEMCPDCCAPPRTKLESWEESNLPAGVEAVAHKITAGDGVARALGWRYHRCCGSRSGGGGSRGRNKLPKDLASPALFLVSEDSDFATGQTLVVDAGVIYW